MFNLQPQFVKIMTGGLQFLSVLLLLPHLVGLSNKKINITLKLLFLYIVIQIIRCLVSPTDVAFTTYIFSPFNVFYSSLPLFMLLAFNSNLIRKLVLISAFCCFVSLFIVSATGIGSFMLFLFGSYIRKRKIMFLVFLISIGYDILFGLGVFGIKSARSFLLEICLMTVFGVIVYILRSRKLLKLTMFSILLIPVILVSSIFIYEASILEVINEYGGSNNEVVGSDTRTFLYLEIIQNLKSINDWLFGLGYNARYFSEYFLTTTSELADHYMRSNVEVGFLQLLLKGGIILVVFHYSILITAVINGIRKSRNMFCLGCSLFLTGYIFLSFIVDYPSRNPVVQVVPWICAGVCFSEIYLGMSDREIKSLFAYLK